MVQEKANLITLSVIALIIILAGLYTFSVIKNERELRARDNEAMNALSISESQNPFTNFDGIAVDLSEYVGEILIVNSWSSWSPDSAIELPMLADLAEDYSEYGITIVAINRAEPKTTAERFLTLIEVDKKVNLILDPDDIFYKSIGGYGMPETIIYDKSGGIVFHGRGVSDYEILKKHLDDLIN